MIETSIPRPASLNKGLMITIVLAAVGYLNSFFAQSSMKEVMLRQGLPPEAVAQSGGMGVGMLIFSLLITGTLLFYIAKGFNVARVIWTVLGVLGVLMSVFSIGLLFSVSTFVGLLAVVGMVGNLIGIVFMWMRDSSQWFAQMKADRLAP